MLFPKYLTEKYALGNISNTYLNRFIPSKPYWARTIRTFIKSYVQLLDINYIKYHINLLYIARLPGISQTHSHIKRLQDQDKIQKKNHQENM